MKPASHDSGAAHRLLRSRRGIVFLITALLLVAVFLTILYSQTQPTEQDRQESIVTRISTMNDFLRDFDSDVSRATYISGYRSFIALEQYTSANGAFLANASPVFIEAFLNGTINGESYDILTNSTFSEYLARVNADAAQEGIILNVTVLNVALNQSTPWSVDVTFDLAVNVTDTRGLASWDYTKPFTTAVSILNLRDPLYSVETNGLLPNTIIMSPYNNSNFVTGSNNTTNLNNEVEQMYYREDPYAPSYLQRLEGQFNASSKYGIASIVNLDALNAQGLSVYTDRSVIDAYYFSGRNATNWCPHRGSPLPSWFKIDNDHYNDPQHNYELSLLNATTC